MHLNHFYSTKDGKELKFFRDKLIYTKIKQKMMSSDTDTMLILASISNGNGDRIEIVLIFVTFCL